MTSFVQHGEARSTSTQTKFEIRSSAFRNGDAIPKLFSGEGKDISPPLEFASPPKGTAEMALLVEDPDAPQAEPWVHWILYGFSPDLKKLPEAIEAGQRRLSRLKAQQGENSFGKIGYGGPLPPPGHGWHHYHFRLFALDAPLKIPPGVSKREFMKAIDGHVLAEADLVGLYRR
jgi:Raf kinase inhibitor-like YbhB/YbcL family protein